PPLRLRRFAVVPLRFQERSIGVVLVDNKTSRRPIMRRGVAQLELFCQQLQNLVSNARLWAETQRRERDATLLLDVTRRLSSTLDLEQVLDIITESTLGVLECDASGFYRWEAARDGLVFVRGRHVPDSMTRAVILRSGEGVSGRAFAERKPRSTPDASCPTPSPALGRPSAPWAPPSCSSATPAPYRPRSSAGAPCPRTPCARSPSRCAGGRRRSSCPT